MNLTGYGWVENDIYKEVVSKENYGYWYVRCREMVNGGEDENFAYRTEEIIERIKNEILDEIYELGYAYEQQDWERQGEVIKELLTLRGYLVDE